MNLSSSHLIFGCGYLGRRVAAEWIKQGQRVAALTRSPANARQLEALGIEPVIGDVLYPSSLTSLPAAETVLYAVGFDRSAGTSQRTVYVNGLENVLGAIRGRAGRLIYISSTSVYGQDGGEWIDETSECRPTQSNGQVCLEAEQTLRRHAADAIILRLAGLYGPGRLLRRLEELRAGAQIAGNPDAFLNLIHVDDAVNAVLDCEACGEPGETYLACDNRPVRRREYFNLLATLAATPLPVFVEGAAATRSAGLNKRCSNKKLRERLGVELKYPTIDEGLRQALEQIAEP